MSAEPVSKKKKRTRAANMSTVEKSLLVELVMKYRNIIDNKRTDALTAKAKDDGWKALAEEFQAASVDGVRREWSQLKHVRTNFVIDTFGKTTRDFATCAALRTFHYRTG